MELALDHRHQRRAGEPGEETDKERHPRQVEGPHLRRTQGEQIDAICFAGHFSYPVKNKKASARQGKKTEPGGRRCPCQSAVGPTLVVQGIAIDPYLFLSKRRASLAASPFKGCVGWSRVLMRKKGQMMVRGCAIVVRWFGCAAKCRSVWGQSINDEYCQIS